MDKGKVAIIIGNSSGIGLEITRRLLAQGFSVIGLSKSSSSLVDDSYRHILMDVTAPNFESLLFEIASSLGRIDIGIYCAGIGEKFEINNLAFETQVVRVNFMSAVIATNVLLDKMRMQDFGHFIGLSSIADSVTSSTAPSYVASKAGISRYWESLGLAYAGQNIQISNVRFGFVDTKMAKSSFKPMMIDSVSAAKFIEKIIERPRIRASKPIFMSVIAQLLGVISRRHFFCR